MTEITKYITIGTDDKRADIIAKMIAEMLSTHKDVEAVLHRGNGKRQLKLTVRNS